MSSVKMIRTHHCTVNAVTLNLQTGRIQQMCVNQRTSYPLTASRTPT